MIYISFIKGAQTFALNSQIISKKKKKSSKQNK